MHLGGSGDDWAPSRHFFSRHLWTYSDIIGCVLHSILSYGSILDEDNERARRSQSRERSRRDWKALWAKTSLEILRDFAYKSDYWPDDWNGRGYRNRLSQKSSLSAVKPDFGFIHSFQRNNRGTYSVAPMSNWKTSSSNCRQYSLMQLKWSELTSDYKSCPGSPCSCTPFSPRPSTWTYA